MSLINQMLRDLESRSNGAQAHEQVFSGLIIGESRPRRRIWPWLFGTVVVAGSAAGAALWFALFAPTESVPVANSSAPVAEAVPAASPAALPTRIAERQGPLLSPAGPQQQPIEVATIADVAPPADPEPSIGQAPPPAPSGGLRARVADIPAPSRAAENTARSTPERPVISKRPRAPTTRQRAISAFQQALALLRDGRSSDAEQQLHAALKFDPDYREATVTLGALLVRARRLVEAAPVLEQGLARHPADPEVAQLMARLRLEQGNVASAIAVLEQAASGASGDAAYLSLLAQLRQRNGDHAESVRRYREALRLRPEPAWFVGVAISLEALGQRDAATAAYRRAVVGGASGSLGDYARSRLGTLSGQ